MNGSSGLGVFTFDSVGDCVPAIATALTANCLPECDQGMLVVLMSRSGAGKSYTWREYVKALGCGYLCFTLSQQDSVDWRGIPKVGQDGFCDWMTMRMPFEDVCGDGKLFPTGGIIHLEEMDRCLDKSVLNTVIPMISSHELDGRKISRKWHFVASCNGESDSGSTSELMDALLKRGCFLYIDNPKPEKTIEFGRSKRWGKKTLKWASRHLGWEHYEWRDLRPCEKDASNNFVIPPRTLMFISALELAGEMNKTDDSTMLRLIQGVAGTEVAVSYMTDGDVGLFDVLRNPMGAELLSNPVSGIIGMARELNGMCASVSQIGQVKTYIHRHRKEVVGAMLDAASRECPALVA